MGEPVKIAAAEKKDLKEILSLQKDCYLSEAAIYDDYSILPLKQTIESIVEEYEGGTIFLKGLIDEKIVASVRATIKDETVLIGRLIVDRNFQNRKIEQTMMTTIENQLNNCLRYELFTGHLSEKNISLYKKLGYQEFQRKKISANLVLVFMQKNKVY
ncbi:GNAT family N-acetyltransferase [Arachidicoccus soli]|uniref:GNAT family N-acetyltransferase n=1 Tax=Arachidicoccus soli TaxID=2341117 RepID=A0A386HND4_9BACT|nr:GNAT family N-acetyltransferase [Arachidicoccus soli]AYD47263.1 GNAT family N-acetyltransferase [Arachidicoccus soli]